jgi:F0F1-type ATP synthase membrane subunit b/b'
MAIIIDLIIKNIIQFFFFLFLCGVYVAYKYYKYIDEEIKEIGNRKDNL